MPEEGLKVVELGEDGDRYLVEGTTDPRTARSALELQLGSDLGDPEGGEEAAADLAAIDARADWWWETREGHDEEAEVLRNAHEYAPPPGTVLFSAVVFA